MSQHELAAHFRLLHAAGAEHLLVLPNAWDAMSARVVEAAGASAIATTSAGISWALGYPDGQGLTRDAMVDAVRRIVDAVHVPVTADVESGYGDGSPADIAATVRAVIGAGAVGVNFEDSPGPNGAPLRDIAEQSTSLKLGMYTPGTHIPVVDEVGMLAEQPDYVMILSWHYAAPIIKALRAKGLRSKIIVPLPKIQTIS